MFNDVALTSDGAFYVTEMYNRMMAFDELIAAGIAARILEWCGLGLQGTAFR